MELPKDEDNVIKNLANAAARDRWKQSVLPLVTVFSFQRHGGCQVSQIGGGKVEWSRYCVNKGVSKVPWHWQNLISAQSNPGFGSSCKGEQITRTRRPDGEESDKIIVLVCHETMEMEFRARAVTVRNIWTES